jgi:serine/threonine-protein kinase RsbW
VTADRLHVEASLEVLAQVRAHVRAVVRRLGGDASAVSGLVQAVDEWLTNVTVHGYRGSPGPVDIDVWRDGSEVTVRVRDRAPAFDPASAPTFDAAVPLERRSFGGMGIALIRDLCSTFEHQSLPDGGNEVTMSRSAHTAPPEGGTA